jgi:tRNA-dihydrouridine synthase
MIGRGVFHDPYVFANQSPWVDLSRQQKIDLYKKHIDLFTNTRPNPERSIRTLNKFCKIYINGFDGAKELREQLMDAQNIDKLLEHLK